MSFRDGVLARLQTDFGENVFVSDFAEITGFGHYAIASTVNKFGLKKYTGKIPAAVLSRWFSESTSPISAVFWCFDKVDQRCFVTTRADALDNAEVYYRTGRQCINGHFAPRKTSTGCCTECVRGKSARGKKAAILGAV